MELARGSDQRKRVAFFGGTFDPPHLGHLAVARAAREALRLDRVLFAPVGAQPLKPAGATATFEDRLAMTRLAITGEQGFEVSQIDAPRADDPNKPNFTIDTLATLRAVLPDTAELFCLMGADSFLNLRDWHRASEIPFAAEMIVAARPREPLDDLTEALPESLTMKLVEGSMLMRVYSISDSTGRTARLYLLPGLNVDISATAIRNQVGAVPMGRGVVPFAVAEYIRERELYR